LSNEHLVAMAKDIAAFFTAEPDDQLAAAAIAHHLRRFWDPRMRRKLMAHLQAGTGELPSRLKAAMELMARDG